MEMGKSSNQPTQTNLRRQQGLYGEKRKLFCRARVMGSQLATTSLYALAIAFLGS